MRALRRTNQGGSVAIFIVIGVLLAVGLVGSVYFVNWHSAQVRKEQVIAESKKQPDSKKPVKVVGDNADNNAESKPTESSNASSGLPTTGPEISIGPIFVAFLMTTVTVSYILSRRRLIRSL